MDLLSNIERLAGSLQKNPASIDLDNIRLVLLEAHEVISNGLNRSQLGKTLQASQDETTRLSDKNSELSAANLNLTSECDTLKKRASSLDVLYDHLKKVVVGRINLAYSEPESIRCLTEQVENAKDVGEFLRIKATVDKDFKARFDQPSGRIKLKSGQIVNPAPYLSGG